MRVSSKGPAHAASPRQRGLGICWPGRAAVPIARRITRHSTTKPPEKIPHPRALLASHWPRRPDSEEFAHQLREIIKRRRQLEAFVEVLSPTQGRSSHPATIQNVCKRSLQMHAPPAQEVLAVFALGAAVSGLDRLCSGLPSLSMRRLLTGSQMTVLICSSLQGHHLGHLEIAFVGGGRFDGQYLGSARPRASLIVYLRFQNVGRQPLGCRH